MRMKPTRYLLAAMLPLAALLLSSCEDAAAPAAIKGNVIAVQNILFSPVVVKLNGINIGVVPADTTVFIQRGWLDKSVELDWQTVMPVGNGKVLGDSMGGTFTDLGLKDGDTALYSIDAVVGSGASTTLFFAPHITNNSTAPMQVGINMETTVENRTDVVVPGGTQARYIGYYLLVPTTNIRVYRPENAYNPLLFLDVEFGVDFDLNDVPISGVGEVIFNDPPPRIKSGDIPAGMIAPQPGNRHTQVALQAGQRMPNGYIWAGNDQPSH
ncbi:MAG: hypothetical protein IT211_00280 [Armatimonadetes bacterium]|nr:hypothetical protein [Armatimonadota bacterium]